MSYFTDQLEAAAKENYNLVTEEEKSLVNNSPQYSSLLTSEILKTSTIDEIEDRYTKRYFHLKGYKKTFSTWKKNRTIELKAEAVNLAHDQFSKFYDQCANPDFLGVNFFKVDGSIFAKYSKAFDFDTVEGKTKTGAGFRISSITRISSNFVGIEITVNLWHKGAEVNYFKFTDYVYKKDNDMLVEVLPKTARTPVNVKKEIANAQKYLKFKEESEAKLSALKAKCNSDILQSIENNR